MKIDINFKIIFVRGPGPVFPALTTRGRQKRKYTNLNITLIFNIKFEVKLKTQLKHLEMLPLQVTTKMIGTEMK